MGYERQLLVQNEIFFLVLVPQKRMGVNQGSLYYMLLRSYMPPQSLLLVVPRYNAHHDASVSDICRRV